MAETLFEEIRSSGSRLLDEVRRIVDEGNARRIIVKNKKGRTLFEAPLTLSSVGAGGFFLLHPIISSVAAFIMFTNDIRIFVERYEDTGRSHTRDEHEIEADYIPVQDDEEYVDNQGENKS